MNVLFLLLGVVCFFRFCLFLFLLFFCCSRLLLLLLCFSEEMACMLIVEGDIFKDSVCDECFG